MPEPRPYLVPTNPVLVCVRFDHSDQAEVPPRFGASTVNSGMTKRGGDDD